MAHALTSQAFDCLLPMHLRVAPTGHIVHAGPTLAKLRPENAILGQRFLEIFHLRRPREITRVQQLRSMADRRLQLQFRDGPQTSFKGVMVPVADSGDLLVNLSFGISVVDAIRDYELHAVDFAPTDLTIEMLYLLEAKAAVMEESRRLNSRLQAARVAAEEQAFTDTLTGLKNRRALDHILSRYVAHGAPFALMHLDLDFFKSVNDQLGHAAGDHVLQTVARIMVKHTRDRDTLVRAGGDEFVLLFPALTDPKVLLSLSRRLIAALEEPIGFNGQMCRISGSIGIAISDEYETLVAEQLLDDADRALYASKRGGRGRATIFTPDLPPLASMAAKGHGDQQML